MKKYFFIIFAIFIFIFLSNEVSAHQPHILYLEPENIEIIINNPEISQAFFDNLKGQPRNYIIDSKTDFELYVNLLVPEVANRMGRYSADIFLLKEEGNEELITSLNAYSSEWEQFYEPFGRDYYLKGPEFSKQVPAGRYKIRVYSLDNLGRYVLIVGKKESYDVKSLLNVYWQLPLLKITFFETSVLEFFFTPFGIAGVGVIGGLLIFLAFINYLIAVLKQAIKHSQAKTLLLTSGGMEYMKDEVIELLQKPAYDVTVGFIMTAYKPYLMADPYYKNRDLQIMRDELGFNIEEIDIEGKKEYEVLNLLKLKDIIFVADGNAFYLLRAMRECNFEKIIKRLLKQGKVYIGVSAGSIVAGCTIQTAALIGDKNFVGLKNLKGLNLVPFDIFVHYKPEYAEIIKQFIKNPKKRAKKLKILTDGQAIFVQSKEVMLIGEGEAIII